MWKKSRMFGSYSARGNGLLSQLGSETTYLIVEWFFFLIYRENLEVGFKRSPCRPDSCPRKIEQWNRVHHSRFLQWLYEICFYGTTQDWTVLKICVFYIFVYYPERRCTKTDFLVKLLHFNRNTPNAIFNIFSFSQSQVIQLVFFINKKNEDPYF